MPDASHELLKAEYERIKSEQAQRIGFRDNMLFVYLAAVGAVVGAGARPAWLLRPAPGTHHHHNSGVKARKTGG